VGADKWGNQFGRCADGGVYQFFETGICNGFVGGSGILVSVLKVLDALLVEVAAFDDEHLKRFGAFGRAGVAPFGELSEHGLGVVEVGRQLDGDVGLL